MKASETSLRNLLEGGKQFQVPLFQRPYSWEKKNWETLWEDIMSLYREEVQGFYFLDPIVTQSVPGTADGISPFIVIDGQQRLTTLTILLAALRHYLSKSDNKMAKELHELYLINKFKQNDDIYKVLPTQDDREAYTSIIKAKTKKSKEIKKSGKIYEAYNFFYDRINKPELSEPSSLEYAKLRTVILERLILVNITSDDRDNPYLIFESLNNKGQELTQADLVRNYIFMKLPSEQREEVYRQEWLPLQEQFKINMGKKEYTEELTTAFWFYLRKDGDAVNHKEVYKTIKIRLDNTNLGIQDELKHIINYAKYYQRLNFESSESEIKLNRYFKRFRRLDFTTCQIFLLNVYQEYEKERLSLENFEKILRYLESYFVRRWFAKVSTKVLGNVFKNLYHQVHEESPNDLVSGLRTVMMSFEGNQVWPEDDSFRQGIITESVYSKTSIERVKLILESLEESLSKERVEPQNLTVEHVMPQNLTKEWRTMLGVNADTVHKRWVHTLPNLTLTGYNPELSNKPFNKKLSILRSSNVTMNQYFRDVEVWNEEAIQSRAEHLANLAVKVWPR